MNLACVKKRSNCTTLTRLVHGCRQMMTNRKSKYIYIYLFARSLERWLSKPRTYKQNHSPRRGTRGRGGGGCGIPPRSFWYVAVFWNDFTFSANPLIFLTRWGIFYGWWRCWRPVASPTMVAILAAILNFTKNWKQAKTTRNGIFWCHFLHEKKKNT